MFRRQKTALCDSSRISESRILLLSILISSWISHTFLIGRLAKYCLGFRESCTTVRAAAVNFNLVLAPRPGCCWYFLISL
jgi:hypothetical protein